VIDDGPVAMGPIVYLIAGTHSVSTLICRCMPAQAGKILSTSSYELLPLRLPLEPAHPDRKSAGQRNRGVLAR